MRKLLGVVVLLSCLALAGPIALAHGQSDDTTKDHNKRKSSGDLSGRSNRSLGELDQEELRNVIQALYLQAVMDMDAPKTAEYGGYTFTLRQRGSIPYAEIGLGSPVKKPSKKDPTRKRGSYPSVSDLQSYCDMLPYPEQQIMEHTIVKFVDDNNWMIVATISTLEE